jgi:hypothetical protein
MGHTSDEMRKCILDDEVRLQDCVLKVSRSREMLARNIEQSLSDLLDNS